MHGFQDKNLFYDNRQVFDILVKIVENGMELIKRKTTNTISQNLFDVWFNFARDMLELTKRNGILSDFLSYYIALPKNKDDATETLLKCLNFLLDEMRKMRFY